MRVLGFAGLAPALVVLGSSESLMGFTFPCERHAHCARGFECSSSFPRLCVTSATSANVRPDNDVGVADQTAIGTDGASSSSGPPDSVRGATRLTLDLTEVTKADYASCVSAGECSPPSSDDYCNWVLEDRFDHPITCIDWYQAKSYCEWTGGRLPRAEEWEIVATNGELTTFPWGNDDATCDLAVMNLEGVGCGGTGTWPDCVKSAGKSQGGHCDLAGNVWEWTDTSSGVFKVMRGGGWADDATKMGKRGWSAVSPTSRNIAVGFRCIREKADE
jgi:formylglycine-generating enzyme required for sulfatase activity